MTVLRSFVFLFWIYGGVALFGLGAAPVVALWRDAAMPVAKGWASWTLFGARWILGIRVRIEGREHIPQGAALIASKHQSMLDTVLPFVLFNDPCIVLKEELLRAPVYGWYASRMRMIPVAREAHAAALKAMLRAARPEAEAGRQIVLFPEGTRTTPGVRGDYKPGVAALYKDLGLPVTPVALNAGLCWPAKGVIKRSGEVTVRFLPAIPPGLPRAEFMAELERRIEDASLALLPAHMRPAPTAAETAVS